MCLLNGVWVGCVWWLYGVEGKGTRLEGLCVGVGGAASMIFYVNV